jgi:hypothetical protein
VRFADGKKTVIEGPFAETQQLVAGFWIWQVQSKAEALEWAKRCPNPMPGEEAELELRQLFEAADFAESDPTGELLAKEEELRKVVEARC